MVEWCTQNLRRNGSISRGTSHATTKERYQYTTFVDITNTRYKRLQSLIQNLMRHVRSESAREQRIALFKSYEWWWWWYPSLISLRVSVDVKHRVYLLTDDDDNGSQRCRPKCRNRPGGGGGGVALSPFLIGRMFLREPSRKYSAKLVGS